MQKEELLEQLGETYGYVQHLVEKKVDYFKLEMAEKSATTISGLITGVVLGVLGLITFFLALITLGFYLTSVMDSGTKGFGTVTLIMFVLLLLIFMLRRVLITDPAVSKVISSFFSNDGKEV